MRAIRWGWVISTVFFVMLSGFAWGWDAAWGTFLLIMFIGALVELIDPSGRPNVKSTTVVEYWQTYDDEEIQRRQNPTAPMPEEHPLIVLGQDKYRRAK